MNKTIAIGGDAFVIVAAVHKVFGTLGFNMTAFPHKHGVELQGVSDFLSRYASFDVFWRFWPAVEADCVVWCTTQATEAQRLCACMRSYASFVAKRDMLKVVVIYPGAGNMQTKFETCPSVLYGLPDVSLMLEYLSSPAVHQGADVVLKEYRSAVSVLLHDFKNRIFWTGSSCRNNGAVVRALFENLRSDMQAMSWASGVAACEQTLEFMGYRSEHERLAELWLRVHSESIS